MSGIWFDEIAPRSRFCGNGFRARALGFCRSIGPARGCGRHCPDSPGPLHCRTRSLPTSISQSSWTAPCEPLHSRSTRRAEPCRPTLDAVSCCRRRGFWPVALARELDDAILHLRLNEEEIGTWVFRTSGEAALVEAADGLLTAYADDWLIREITLYLKRTLAASGRERAQPDRPGLSRAVVSPAACSNSCWPRTRSYMLDGRF